MVRRDRFLTKNYVALCTGKLRVLSLFIDLEIQNSAVVGCLRDVTAVSAAARANRHFQALAIDGIESSAGSIMAAQTAQVRMLTAFMSEGAGGNSRAPPGQDRFVSHSHFNCQFRIEIHLRVCRRRRELVANFTLL